MQIVIDVPSWLCHWWVVALIWYFIWGLIIRGVLADDSPETGPIVIAWLGSPVFVCVMVLVYCAWFVSGGLIRPPWLAEKRSKAAKP